MAYGTSEDISNGVKTGVRTGVNAAKAAKTVSKAATQAASGNVAGAAATVLKDGKATKFFVISVVALLLIALFISFCAPLVLYSVIKQVVDHIADTIAYYHEELAINDGKKIKSAFNSLKYFFSEKPKGTTNGELIAELGDMAIDALSDKLTGDKIHVDINGRKYITVPVVNIHGVVAEQIVYLDEISITKPEEADSQSQAEDVEGTTDYNPEEDNVLLQKQAVARRYKHQILAGAGAVNAQIEKVYNAIDRKDLQKYLEEKFVERFKKDYSEQLAKQEQGIKNEREDFNMPATRKTDRPQDPVELKKKQNEKKLYSDWHDIEEDGKQELGETTSAHTKDDTGSSNDRGGDGKTMKRDYHRYEKEGFKVEDKFFEEDGQMVQYVLPHISYYISKTKMSPLEAISLLTLYSVMTSETPNDIDNSGFVYWCGTSGGENVSFPAGSTGRSYSVDSLKGGFMPMYLVLQDREQKYSTREQMLDLNNWKDVISIIKVILKDNFERQKYNAYKVSPIDLLIYVTSPSIEGTPETKKDVTSHKFFQWVPKWNEDSKAESIETNIVYNSGAYVPETRDKNPYIDWDTAEFTYSGLSDEDWANGEHEIVNVWENVAKEDRAIDNAVRLPGYYSTYPEDGFAYPWVNEKYEESQKNYQSYTTNWVDKQSYYRGNSAYHEGHMGTDLTDSYFTGGYLPSPSGDTYSTYEEVYNEPPYGEYIYDYDVGYSYWVAGGETVTMNSPYGGEPIYVTADWLCPPDDWEYYTIEETQHVKQYEVRIIRWDYGYYEGFNIPHMYNWEWVPNNYVGRKQHVVKEVAYGMSIEVDYMSPDMLISYAGMMQGDMGGFSTEEEESESED